MCFFYFTKLGEIFDVVARCTFDTLPVVWNQKHLQVLGPFKPSDLFGSNQEQRLSDEKVRLFAKE